MASHADRDELRALLDRPNIHDITAAADEARRDRHDRTTTVAVVEPFDPRGAHTRCPLTGIRAGNGGFARSLDDIHDVVTDLLVLVPEGASADEVRSIWRLLPSPPADGEDEMLPTVQLGTTDTWIEAGIDHDLAAWVEQGMRVVSDGIDPRNHPARGIDPAARWTSFWHTAANVGLRGHATVLFGPDHDLDSVFAQIDAINAVQADTGVFLSVSPCVIGAGPAGDDDDALTHASFDLRVLAACRLGLPGVEHVSLRYERSDLKTAHTALLCGVDDLIGHLFLDTRDRKADTEAKDLSLREMRAWLEEADFTARVRNGLFATEDFAALLGDAEETA